MTREHQIGVAVTCTFLCLTGAVIGLKMRNHPPAAKSEKAPAKKEPTSRASRTDGDNLYDPSLFDGPTGDDKGPKENEEKKKQVATKEPPTVTGKAAVPPQQIVAEKQIKKEPEMIVTEQKSSDKKTVEKTTEEKNRNKSERNEKSGIIGYPLCSLAAFPVTIGGKLIGGSSEKQPSVPKTLLHVIASDVKSPPAALPVNTVKEKPIIAAAKPAAETPKPLYPSPLIPDEPEKSSPNTAMPVKSDTHAKQVSRNESAAPFLLGSNGASAPPLPPPAKPEELHSPPKQMESRPRPPAPANSKPTPEGSFFIPDSTSSANPVSQTALGMQPYPPPPARLAPRVLEYTEQDYTCQSGDTFETISQRYYMSEAYANALRRHNQNHARASDGLVRNGAPIAGEKIFIPPADILEQRYGDAIVKPQSPMQPASYTPPSGSLPRPLPPPSIEPRPLESGPGSAP